MEHYPAMMADMKQAKYSTTQQLVQGMPSAKLATPEQTHAVLIKGQLSPQQLAEALKGCPLADEWTRVAYMGQDMLAKRVFIDASSQAIGSDVAGLVELAWPAVGKLPAKYKWMAHAVGPSSFCMEPAANSSKLAVTLLQPVAPSTLQQWQQRVHSAAPSGTRSVDIPAVAAMFKQMLELVQSLGKASHAALVPDNIILESGGLKFTGLDALRLEDWEATAALYPSKLRAPFVPACPDGTSPWVANLPCVCLMVVGCLLGPDHLGAFLKDGGKQWHEWWDRTALLWQRGKQPGPSPGLRVLLAPDLMLGQHVVVQRLQYLQQQGAAGRLAACMLELCAQVLFPQRDQPSVKAVRRALWDHVLSELTARRMLPGQGGPHGDMMLSLNSDLWSSDSQQKVKKVAAEETSHICVASKLSYPLFWPTEEHQVYSRRTGHIVDMHAIPCPPLVAPLSMRTSTPSCGNDAHHSEAEGPSTPEPTTPGSVAGSDNLPTVKCLQSGVVAVACAEPAPKAAAPSSGDQHVNWRARLASWFVGPRRTHQASMPAAAQWDVVQHIWGQAWFGA